MKYAPPGQPGSIVTVAPRYENFIGGKWLAPTAGQVPGRPEPGHGTADHRGGQLHARGRRARAGRRARGQGRVG